AGEAAAHEAAREHRKEAYTMALYVAICLLAALTAVGEHVEDVAVFEIIWGTTLGLALTHWFAFSVSARLVAAGAIRRHDAEAAIAQLTGALAVAALATVPVLLLPASSELGVVRLLLAGLIAAVGYAVARAGAAARGRAVVYALGVMLVAMSVAVVKNVLAGH
ncbi:MAG TPA: hypothetical protein VFI47_06985, partial [Acidimicrobiales bacterium]|nr:hypothetical protein [Acidimicrobiales bacterium]